MSYGIKYRCAFNKRDETACKFEILEIDYSGGIGNLQAADTPVIISQEGASIDPLVPILGSSLKVKFIAIGTEGINRQYQEFLRAKNRQYRIDYYEDSTLFWQGFLLPDNYQEQYIGPPYVVSLIATDQLGDLKNFKYQRTVGNLITELFHYNSYDTHVVSGLRVLSAITDGSHFCYFRSSGIPKLKEGDVLVITVILNMISGTPPKVGMFNDARDNWASNYVDLVHGENRVEVTMTENVEDAWFVFENNLNASSWSCGEVLVEYKDVIYSNWERDSVIIARCLQQTGLELEIRENINVVEAFAAVPGALSNIKSNQDIFIELQSTEELVTIKSLSRRINETIIKGIGLGEQETTWSCYKVLEEMLRPYGARILQVNGRWMLLRIDNQRASYTVHRYDRYGEYIADTTFNPITEFTLATATNVIRPIEMSGILTGLPPWKKTLIRQDYGYKNLIRNGSFEEFEQKDTSIEATTIKFWQGINTPTYMIYPRDEKSWCLIFSGGSTGGTGVSGTDQHFHYTLPILVEGGLHRFRVKFESKVRANETAITNGVKVGFRMWIEADSSIESDVAYRLKTGSATLLNQVTDSSLNITVGALFETDDTWTTFEFETEFGTLRTGTLHIELYRHIRVSTGEITASFYDNIEIYAIKESTVTGRATDYQNEPTPSDQLITIDLDEKANLIPEETVCYFGDGYGFSLTTVDDLYLYKGAKKVIDVFGNDIHSCYWGNSGGDYVSTKTLLGWLEEFLKLMRQTPSQIFRGRIIGNCSFLSVYQDDANGDKQFFTNIVQSYNPRENIWQVEAVELKATPVEIRASFPMEMTLEVTIPDIYVETKPVAEIEVTSVGFIDDGEEGTQIADIAIGYTNSGVAGDAWISYIIRDVATDDIVDEGAQYLSFFTGSGTVYLTGITYPMGADDYYLSAIASENSGYVDGASFNVFSPI